MSTGVGIGRRGILSWLCQSLLAGSLIICLSFLLWMKRLEWKISGWGYVCACVYLCVCVGETLCLHGCLGKNPRGSCQFISLGGKMNIFPSNQQRVAVTRTWDSSVKRKDTIIGHFFPWYLETSKFYTVPSHTGMYADTREHDPWWWGTRWRGRKELLGSGVCSSFAARSIADPHPHPHRLQSTW